MVLLSLRFFFNDTATTEIYTLSLHDALPIYTSRSASIAKRMFASVSSTHPSPYRSLNAATMSSTIAMRSEEHTSELQSQSNLVCRLLLEKKKKTTYMHERIDDAPRRRQ